MGADAKRPWFRGPMYSEARHEPLAELKRWRTVHCAFVQILELAPQRAHRFERHRCLSHPRLPSIGPAHCKARAGAVATVMPGDVVFGDREGLYFIPLHLVEEVVRRTK